LIGKLITKEKLSTLGILPIQPKWTRDATETILQEEEEA
jgi:hypothetical protein